MATTVNIGLSKTRMILNMAILSFNGYPLRGSRILKRFAIKKIFVVSRGRLRFLTRSGENSIKIFLKSANPKDK